MRRDPCGKGAIAGPRLKLLRILVDFSVCCTQILVTVRSTSRLHSPIADIHLASHSLPMPTPHLVGSLRAEAEQR